MSVSATIGTSPSWAAISAYEALWPPFSMFIHRQQLQYGTQPIILDGLKLLYNIHLLLWLQQ